jgi:hypothetical protein
MPWQIKNLQISDLSYVPWLCFGSAPLSAFLALPRLCSRFPPMTLSCSVNSLSVTLDMAAHLTAGADVHMSPGGPPVR